MVRAWLDFLFDGCRTISRKHRMRSAKREHIRAVSRFSSNAEGSPRRASWGRHRAVSSLFGRETPVSLATLHHLTPSHFSSAGFHACVVAAQEKTLPRSISRTVARPVLPVPFYEKVFSCCWAGRDDSVLFGTKMNNVSSRACSPRSLTIWPLSTSLSHAAA